MAKRLSALRHKATKSKRSRKTAKRLAVKKDMLKAKAATRRPTRKKKKA